MKKLWKFMMIMPRTEMNRFLHRTCMLLKYSTDDDDNCRVLYGWTTDKSIAKDFKKSRSKRLVSMKVELDDKEFESFRLEYISEEIRKYTLKHIVDGKFENVPVVLSRAESYVIEEYPLELISVIVDDCVYAQYRNLKEEYVISLDLLMYTYYHDIFYPETEGVSDYAEYQASYDRSPHGFADMRSAMKEIDQLNLFVSIFKDVIE